MIISGGGTGGHIFPALAIADELKRRFPQTEILFVGAKHGMEETVIPQHGYEFRSVWISGIQRKLTIRNILRNLLFPLKLGVSLIQASDIVRSFKPDYVVGVGGYASGPVGRVSSGRGIPLFLCEQNACPGLVNRWLAGKAQKIMLGNADAQKYFPMEKVRVTGNPIRDLKLLERNEAARAMNLSPEKYIVLSIGGSLGARTINEAWLAQLGNLIEADIQLIWQCGKRYYEALKPEVPDHPNIRLMHFIDDMDIAYSAADLIVSRAGGSTISELIALSRPSILIPSPNVAEDHQTKNAKSLADKEAALLIRDADARTDLVPTAIDLLRDQVKLKKLVQNIQAMEKHDAAKLIVDELLTTVNA